MPIFIPPPKAHKTSSHIYFNAQEPVIVQKHFSLVAFMKPHFDEKGCLLSLSFLHNDLVIYKHIFELKEPIIEGSPCGGVFNATLPLSRITQAHYISGMRISSSSHESILELLENGACVYSGFHSYQAQKEEPHSQFVQIYFKKEIIQ